MAASSVAEICAAFFDAIDHDGSGFIEENEIKTIAMVAFHQDEAGAAKTWADMLGDMDSNKDKKISKEEYVAWWGKKTSNKKQDDGTFKVRYVDFLMTRLKKLDAVKSASAFCKAFFDAMDLNGNGFLEEDEIKKISAVAFGEDEAAATKRWSKMLKDMDKNEDKKISQEEYTNFWMSEAKDKIDDDGNFAPKYKTYLSKCLSKLEKAK
mmetsp:Transcript_36796/g.54057  ORF Transcript_36796/g.54057 Transcript_36796/m.54057 type:complete len:209 (+) Transcript_36796:90-716(+)|eukprot:CAMPEP_0195513752 /NCGR_PEP_ID=MMETSP0794_2-20130614/5337_1 /TAXON_ID=515487 /ORGANISM="Stephanopyxis turris, Strain CCMP 815" /LENGTH=208 /DNA_ID=CAMNT_0040641841 /DNA_START=27 /DNA_END=653 /DNA_ORIENTATION=+